jgi:hypothetical protein
VIPPLGAEYPFTGLMMISPSAPLPAGTLVGEIADCTVIVNCGVTDNTVRLRVGEVTVPLESVAVIVTP